jgi:hypothetical protein
VSINPESWGSKNPRTVFLKTGLIRGGIDADIVNMKNDTGQNRWVSAIKIIFLNLGQKWIWGV